MKTTIIITLAILIIGGAIWGRFLSIILIKTKIVAVARYQVLSAHS